MGRRRPEWQHNRESKIAWPMPERKEGKAMTEKGTCQKHGEFVLTEGCLGCLAEKRGEPVVVPDELLQSTTSAETALATRLGSDIEVMGYYNEALKLQQYAESRVITTVEDVKLANDDLSIISRLKKAMDSKRSEYLEPLKAQTEAIRDTYNYLMAPVIEADKVTRDKILGFSKEQERIRREQEEINRKRQEAAEAEMRLNGELSESVNLVEVVPEAPKRVSTDMGTTGQRDNWKWEVVDFALLPDEYKVVDSSLLTAVAKKHHDQKPVPGVRFYNEPIIAVRAR